MTESSPRRLRIGVLGAANIARLFVEGVRPSPKVAVTAVASRDVERARKFASATGIAHVHSTYAALLADPDIDAIYNPLPNSLHAEWSIRAANAGKHVLCEKPLATSASEVRAMFEAATRNGVYLAEAYPYRAQPQTLKLRELLKENAIGRLQLIQAAFGFPLSDASNIRLNPVLAGGSLMDAGCYPVSLVRTIAGERPNRVHAVARWSESGVDRTLVATIEFASGLLAQISCSFATARHRHAFVKTVGSQHPRLHVVFQVGAQDYVFQISLQVYVENWSHHFNSTVEIACHPVRRADVNIFVSTISKIENPAVLQELADDTAHMNCLR